LGMLVGMEGWWGEIERAGARKKGKKKKKK
jgi:hypothetical protein